MPLDLPPPPALWLPPKPAIIRAAPREDLALIRAARQQHRREFGSFPFPVFCPASRPPATIVCTDSATDTTDTTTYTFTNRAIGTASADRYVIVECGGQNASSLAISSVTIAGNAAAQAHTQVGSGGGEFMRCGIYILLVPTGTTATIVVTFSGTMRRCGIGVFAATGLLSATPTATTDATTSTASVSLAIAAGGIAVGYSQQWLSGTPSSYTWTGLTEGFDAGFESNNTHSGASLASAAGSGGLSITSTPANAATTACHVFAAFR